MGMSEFYGERNDEESAATLLRALDLGVTFLDTADTYGIGDNEELVGKTIRGRRDEVFLATKFANVRTKAEPAKWAISGKPEYVKSACDASLKRLGVDHIDLYYQHRVDPADADRRHRWRDGGAGEGRQGEISGTVGGFAGDDPAGAQGASDHSAANRVFAVVARSWKARFCRPCANWVSALCRTVRLGRGFLTGAITKPGDLPSKTPGRSGIRDLPARILREIRCWWIGCARSRNAEASHRGQLALAWVLAKGEDLVPIPGTKRRKYLEENAAAADIVLTPSDVAELEAAIPLSQVAGDRYAEANMKSIDR